jgi:hypothetical protein
MKANFKLVVDKNLQVLRLGQEAAGARILSGLFWD